MKKLLKIALIVMLAVALFTLVGRLLYWHFIGSQIKDGGEMENPDASRAGKALVEFSWQQNHMNYSGCFSLRFYLENDMPVMTGWFPSQDGVAVRENGKDAFSNQIPWQLTWVQWFALQNLLAETELPAYRKLPPGTWDETDSKICVVWRAGDEMVTEKRNGRNADALETLALRIAEEAYTAAQLEAELHEVNETAVLIGIYWDQKAAHECFRFLLNERTLLFRPEKQMYFSYRYQGDDGRAIFRQNVTVEPEKAQACLDNIAGELRVLNLPAYRPDAHLQDTTDSCITATWLDGDISFTNRYDAQAAQAVYDLLVDLAEEAEGCGFADSAPESSWKCPSCGMPNRSRVFCVECGTKRSPAKQ